MKQVWIVNHYALPPEQSGGTRHYNLASLMLEHGIESTIFASNTNYSTGENLRDIGSDGYTETKEGNIRFIWFKAKPYSGNSFSRLFNMLDYSIRVINPRISNRLPPPDIIIGSSPHLFAALAAYLLSRKYKIPFALEVRDIWPKSMLSLMGLSKFHPLIILLSVIEKFLYERAKLVIGLLQGVGNHAEKVVGHPIPWMWIPNGVTLEDYPETSFHVKGDVFNVAYTGAHGIPNSLDTALDAALILQEIGEDRIHFNFTGDGVNKNELIRIASEKGLRNVKFFKPVPKSSIPSILSNADALLLLFKQTDLYHDGLSPNKMFDYLAASRPVIMAVDSPHDPIAQANAGVSIPPEDPQALADAILHLSKLPAAERQAMGERGRAYVMEHHDMKGLAAKLANALHVLAGK
ncbi:glycosyltransferase family 4 protein [Deinococcus seoulensis]|uniref:glycosyltransferase family 4 protein n=1 Tax=Deinococcus seoulensis TaxID=1837379 RepID=UPI001662CAFD|nr:glycosyltransferase family 4 protein [Deinococcus seoulensis]